MPYLIDGPNLLFNLRLSSNSINGEIELISILQEFARLERKQVEVFFDGTQAPQGGTRKLGAVTVHWFAQLGTTAESAIRNRLKRLGKSTKNWTIVSSDREIQAEARAAHAEVISSDSFAEMLKEAQHSPSRLVPERKLSSEEVEEWLKVFEKKNRPKKMFQRSNEISNTLSENKNDIDELPNALQPYAQEIFKYDETNESNESLQDEEQTKPPTYTPPVAGYISDLANQDAQDLLNIEREVANIANVLTFKQVHPPLALGLFGDWGSGKTFFMGKLRRYVSQVANHYQREEKVSKTEAMWCSRVAQIEFNAWHFSDSNLWASLVTRIYEGLDRELNKEKETVQEIKKRIIEAQIKEATEKSIQAESQLDLAKTQVNSAEENLKRKRQDREGKENQLKSLISKLPDLLKDQEFDKQLREAASALGVPEAAETYEALESLDGQIKNFSGRLKGVIASLVYSPSTIWLMVLFVVAMPILLTLAIELWGAWLTEIGKRVAEISSFLLFIIGWLQAQARRGLKMVRRVESAVNKARKIRQDKIENDVNVIRAKKALTDAQTEEQAAQTNLELAKTELQRLQDELQELRPERKLQRLIEARANSGAYAQHLGIISLIRSDFENMSRIMAEMIAERRDFKKAPPIQRIILYIDDLDRCKPERVVEVLEAIHLLLFFQLFVVVVAVDPRWLRHSLAQHYPATLSESGRIISLHGSAGISLFSSPQDYLEKIFQIPFALRPVEKGGYQSLVVDLLKPVDEAVQPSPISEEIITPEASQASPTSQQLEIDTDKLGQETFKSNLSEIESEKDLEERTFMPIPPRQLEFTKWEQEDIQQLWLMFRTPRTVKRFINIYRLLRAGLATDRDVKTFEGTKKKPGEYQVALLLLALITAFPNESNKLLYRLDTWLDIQELSKRRSSVNWGELIKYLKQEPDISSREILANRMKKQRPMNGNDQSGKFNSEVSDAESTDDSNDAQSSWNFMLDCLNRVVQENAWKKSFKITTLRTWVMQIARFSFSVQPM
jgi:predicted RNA-binding protein with PIN domain